MIVHKYGTEINTENMDNNHLYTYALSGNLIHKIDVNFELEKIKEFLELVKDNGEEKDSLVENIEYELLSKRPIEKRPFDEIKEFLCDPKDFLESESLLGPNIIKKAYIKWVEYPSIYHDLNKLVEFKTQKDINKEKDIDLSYYLEKLDEIGLKEEFLNILDLKILKSIEKSKLEDLEKYINNGFISMNKQVEIANKYLDYGIKNKELVKKFK